MNTTRRFGALSSSVDPDQLANTVRGAILAISGLIIWGALKWFNIELTAQDVTELATEVGMKAGAIWMAYGLIQKLVAWFAQRFLA